MRKGVYHPGNIFLFAMLAEHGVSRVKMNNRVLRLRKEVHKGRRGTEDGICRKVIIISLEGGMT